MLNFWPARKQIILMHDARSQVFFFTPYIYIRILKSLQLSLAPKVEPYFLVDVPDRRAAD